MKQFERKQLENVHQAKKSCRCFWSIITALLSTCTFSTFFNWWLSNLGRINFMWLNRKCHKKAFRLFVRETLNLDKVVQQYRCFICVTNRGTYCMIPAQMLFFSWYQNGWFYIAPTLASLQDKGHSAKRGSRTERLEYDRGNLLITEMILGSLCVHSLHWEHCLEFLSTPFLLSIK